jgi:WD40 repeat protein/3',5'-cyclic AMP phosphodiesterase CpdA
MGVLVGAREVLTCAHVVNAALGREQRAQESPEDVLAVDFPLLPGIVAGRARVARWLPPPRADVAGDDIAGLVLYGDPPPGAVPAQLVSELPRPGQAADVFGHPREPMREDGVWVEVMVRGVVGGGSLQLDGTVGAELRVQRGFSGSPVCERGSGRVVGLVSAAPETAADGRDNYAVTAERLRLAWPEVLDRRGSGAGGRGRRRAPVAELTVLHVSDPQLGHGDVLGTDGRLIRADDGDEALFGRLHADLTGLEDEHGLRPDLLVVTGDLTEWGRPSEFEQVVKFLTGLAEAVALPRRNVVVVPGSHDVNREACESYFLAQRAGERDPVPPYWPKWEHFAAAFSRFYEGVDGVSFAPDEPWTLFEMPELNVVVAGLNSTIAESHLEEDRYGWVGSQQLRWFAEQLAGYRERGWLRLAAVHHNAVGGATLAVENLRDADDLDSQLGETGLVNVVLHGCLHDGRVHRLRSGLLVLSTGRVAASAHDGLREAPTQYELVTIRPDGVTRHARAYAPGQHRWVGDTGISQTGSEWQVEDSQTFANVHATFSAAADEDAGQVSGHPDDDAQGDAGDVGADTDDGILDRVREATAVSLPAATITIRREGDHGYLRVSNPLPGGGAELWPVGVIDGDVTTEDLDAFAAGVHAEFAAADPQVRSQLVYTGAPASHYLVARARRLGFWLRSFVEYQGLLDLRPLVASQAGRLAGDRLYPPKLYVPQRYRLLEDPPSATRDGLLDQVLDWLDADGARFVMLLGDFGRGKTFLLRQLARQLPERLPGVMPVLVELRGLEKAPSLDELLAQHLVRHGVDSVELPKLRYMVRSGRLALLFDGFDELALRISYDHAADYLRTMAGVVTDRAKIVLTSRTQHFQSTAQVRTALGAWVSTLSASRVAVLADFSHKQIRAFLAKRFSGDATEARARYDLLASVHDLLGLSGNPRMLSFVTGLDASRLHAVRHQHGRVSAAELYRELVDFWLIGEANRQRHGHGMLSLDEEERLAACTALAQRLWTSAAPAIPAEDLSAEVAATLTRLAERGYSAEQAAHTVGSASLLVRTDDGAFCFVHQSVMEWLVANAAATHLHGGQTPDLLNVRTLTPQIADFLCDLAGHHTVQRWADYALAAANTSEHARNNALQLASRLKPGTPKPGGAEPTAGVMLAGADLRSQDLTRRDLRRADLTGADLRGTRLIGTDLTGADLTDADLTGARLVDANLTGANLTGARWQRAALLGVTGLDEPHAQSTAEIDAAAIAGIDAADAVVAPCSGLARCITVSPDAELVAYGQGNAVVLADLATGQPLRVLAGHTSGVSGVAFSPDGALIATSSYDGTARIWETATGRPRGTFAGHRGRVYGVAFSPDGTLIATASLDHTARIWDTATGATRTTLTGHTNLVYGVAFSPDGTLVATASYDGTARIWDTATGATRTTLTGHDDEVYGVAFSPDGTLVATASLDSTARIWDTATGTTRTTLAGHTDGVSGVAFSPDSTLVATSSRDRTARIWDTATGATRTTLTGHAGGVSRVAFSPDGTLVATASRDRTARIWDTLTGTPRTTLASRSRGVSGIASSPNGALLASTCWDNTARIWETATGRTRAVLAGHTGSVFAVAFSADGTLIATTSRDRTARIWDTATGHPRAVLAGHTGVVSGVAFSADGTRIVTASYDRTARIWDTATGRTRAVLATHSREVSAVAFSADGTLVATASYDGTARIWDTATGHSHHTLPGHTDGVYGVAFSPTTRGEPLVATASRDQTVRIWNAADGTHRTTLTGHTGHVSDVAFSPDGTHLATASWDNTARVWNAATGAHLTTLTGHTNWVSGVAFTAGGALLATASADNTVRLWDIATTRTLATLLALPDEGYAVLLPDGTYKQHGDPRDLLWWAIKLCRFAPGELDPYDRQIRRRPQQYRIIGP